MNPSPLTVPVRLGARAYTVTVGHGLLAELGPLTRSALGDRPRRLALVTDSNVAPLYGEAAAASLERAGFNVVSLTVPAGEAAKSLSQVEDLCRRMAGARFDRTGGLVALGGGVVGDLAGFVAAIFFRGIPFIQVPTTIVAQVDSSVGGKTGVNLPEGKNLVGAFHQPAAVLADTATLASLPTREFNEGMAEVIKHAAIRDPDLLPALDGIDTSSPDLPAIVARNVAIKAAIVEEDERETTGTRALLNFGHTIGHGIEAAAGYGRYLHGEAISLGLRAALLLSESVAGLPPADSARIHAALDAFGLPATLDPAVSTEAILDAVLADKKFEQGRIRFVLLRTLGDAFVSPDLTRDHLLDAIEALRSPTDSAAHREPPAPR